MLESMTENSCSTSNDTSDVANAVTNAVLDGIDCVMLYDESTKGIHKGVKPYV